MSKAVKSAINQMKKILVKVKSSKFYVIDSPHRCFWKDLAKNKWEPDTFTLLDRFLDQGHSCLDVGAWIGPITLYAALKAKKVYALEPNKTAFQELCSNISLNKNLSSKIVSINAALTAKRGKFRLYRKKTPTGDSISSLLKGIKILNASQMIKGIVIHDLISKNQIEDLNFIKIDIEGGEYSLLPPMKPFLREKKPTIYLSLHPNFLADGVQKKLTKKSIFFRKLYQFPLFRKLMLYFSAKLPTLRLLQSLDAYKYLYDSTGKKINKWHILFSKRFAEFNSFVAK